MYIFFKKSNPLPRSSGVKNFFSTNGGVSEEGTRKGGILKKEGLLCKGLYPVPNFLYAPPSGAGIPFGASNAYSRKIKIVGAAFPSFPSSPSFPSFPSSPSSPSGLRTGCTGVCFAKNYMAGLVSNHSFKGKRNKIKMNASKIVNNLDRLVSIEYSLDNYHRSNQDTCLVHKPSVFEGQWVQSGDLLADCSASVGGELALGQNILIAYMPWEGYNFEDAILVSERLVYDDLYTSVHIERYELELRQTKQGVEEITRDIPEVSESSIKHLNNFGIAKLGSWIK